MIIIQHFVHFVIKLGSDWIPLIDWLGALPRLLTIAMILQRHCTGLKIIVCHFIFLLQLDQETERTQAQLSWEEDALSPCAPVSLGLQQQITANYHESILIHFLCVSCGTPQASGATTASRKCDIRIALHRYSDSEKGGAWYQLTQRKNCRSPHLSFSFITLSCMLRAGFCTSYSGTKIVQEREGERGE